MATSLCYKVLPEERQRYVAEAREKGYSWILDHLQEEEAEDVARAVKLLHDSKLFATFDEKRKLLPFMLEAAEKRVRDYTTLELLMRAVFILLRSQNPSHRMLVQGFEADVHIFLRLFDQLYFTKKREQKAPGKDVQSILLRTLPRLSCYWAGGGEAAEVLLTHFDPILKDKRRHEDIAWQLLLAALPVRQLTQQQVDDIITRLDTATPHVQGACYQSFITRLVQAEAVPSALPAPLATLGGHKGAVYGKVWGLALAGQDKLLKDFQTAALLSFLGLLEYKSGDKGLSQLSLFLDQKISPPALLRLTKAVCSLVRYCGSQDEELEEVDDEEIDGGAELKGFGEVYVQAALPYCLDHLLAGNGGTTAGLLVQLDPTVLEAVIERAHLTESVTSTKVGKNVHLLKSITPSILQHGKPEDKTWLLEKLRDLLEPGKHTSLEAVLHCVSFVAAFSPLDGNLRLWGSDIFQRLLKVCEVGAALSAPHVASCFSTATELLLNALPREGVVACCAAMSEVIDTKLHDHSKTGEVSPMLNALSLASVYCCKADPAWGMREAEKLQTRVQQEVAVGGTAVSWAACFLGRITGAVGTSFAPHAEKSVQIAQELLQCEEEWKVGVGHELLVRTMAALEPKLRVDEWRPMGTVEIASPQVSWMVHETSATEAYIKHYNSLFGQLEKAELTPKDAHIFYSLVMAFHPLLLAQRSRGTHFDVFDEGFDLKQVTTTRAAVLDLAKRFLDAGLSDRPSSAITKAIGGLLASKKQLISAGYFKQAAAVLRTMGGDCFQKGYVLRTAAVLQGQHAWYKLGQVLEGLRNREEDEIELLLRLVPQGCLGMQETRKTSIMLTSMAFGHLKMDAGILPAKCLQVLTKEDGDLKNDEPTLKGILQFLNNTWVASSMWADWAALKPMTRILVDAAHDSTEKCQELLKALTATCSCKTQRQQIPRNAPAEGVRQLVMQLVESRHEERALSFLAHVCRNISDPSHVPDVAVLRLLNHYAGENMTVSRMSLTVLRSIFFLKKDTKIEGLLQNCDRLWLRRTLNRDKDNEYNKGEELRAEKEHFRFEDAQLWKGLFLDLGDELLWKIEDSDVSLTESNCASMFEAIGGCLKTMKKRGSSASEDFVLSAIQKVGKAASNQMFHEMAAALGFGAGTASENVVKQVAHYLVQWLQESRLSSVRSKKVLNVMLRFQAALKPRSYPSHAEVLLHIIEAVKDMKHVYTYEALRSLVQQLATRGLVSLVSTEEEGKAILVVRSIFSHSAYGPDAYLTSPPDLARHTPLLSAFLSNVSESIAHFVEHKDDYSNSGGPSPNSIIATLRALMATEVPQGLKELVKACSKVPPTALWMAKGQAMLHGLSILAQAYCFTALRDPEVANMFQNLLWAQLQSSNKAVTQSAAVCIGRLYGSLFPSERSHLLDSYLDAAASTDIQQRKCAASALGGVVGALSVDVPWRALSALTTLAADHNHDVSSRASHYLVEWRQAVKEKPVLWASLSPQLDSRGIADAVGHATSSSSSQAFS